MKLIDRDTNKDAIVAYLKNPEGDLESLTEKQRQLLKYYLDGYAIRRNYASMPDAINVLVKLAKQAGEPISASTARRYIIEGQDIIGNTSKLSKEAALHYGLEIIQDAIAMARDQNDPKTMILGAKEYIEKSTREDPEQFDAELLEQHVIEILMDPKAVKMLSLMTTKGNIDLDAIMSNVMGSMATEAEVTDEPGQ